MAKKPKTQYVCQACGYVSPKYLGKCPNCQTWNEMVEEQIITETPNQQTASFTTQQDIKPLKITEISSTETLRIQTQMTELDRVLGGGIVPGSLILIGGDPGIGKSTLLLQVSYELANSAGTVLYISGEESMEQIKLRAERLQLAHDAFYIYAQTDMTKIIQEVMTMRPTCVIIDSIQTMIHPELSGVAGSVGQIRENTALLLKLAKTYDVAIFIVGHVTKEGAIAGPRMLEHMVDTVLYFEGDRHQNMRLLRTVKNRFGPTHELGIFEMQQEGLIPIDNPSQLFLDERLSGTNGSAIVVSMEGTRPLLVEVQALVTSSIYGTAKRTTTGLNTHRVSLIMAVLEKRAGILLQNQDAYLKATGGVKLDEPAIDLAIAMSIVSSYKEREIPADVCFIGEIGLTGELRSVAQVTQRIQEAEKLGFKTIYLPKNNLLGQKQTDYNIHLVGMATVSEVIRHLF